MIPEYDTIAVVTGWSILPSTEGKRYDELARVLEAVDTTYSCRGAGKVRRRLSLTLGE